MTDVDTTSCLCGCGTEVPVLNAKGVPRTGFAHGHNRRGHADPRRPDAAVDTRQRHNRSAALKADVGECEWRAIGGCLGPLHVAHVNGVDRDNRPSNLKKLCQSHHHLLDKGRIDPQRPVMPAFRVDGSGKRRYVPA